MKFSTVTGHQNIKNKLIKNVLNNRISHAQLFITPTGCGGLPMALAYAQYLGCTNRSETDSCGECNSCKKHQKFIHPDVHFVFPVTSTDKIKESDKPISSMFMEEWRLFLNNNPYQNSYEWMEFLEVEKKSGIISAEEANNIISKLSLRAYEGDYKYMIIWMPERMNISAANKILKVLEEPTAKTLFLLVCESADEMLPTILSRTQIIALPKYSEQEIIHSLVNNYQISTTAANEAAYIADGNFNMAMQLAGDGIDNTNFEYFRTWMRICYSQKLKDIMAWVDDVATIGREKQKNLLLYVMQNLRNNLALTIGANSTVKLGVNETDFASKFHQFIHQKNTANIFADINKAYIDIERNVSAKMVLLDISLRLCWHLRVAK